MQTESVGEELDGCGDAELGGNEVYTVPLSTILEWIDADGEVTDCYDACQAAGLGVFADFLSCYVSHPDWPFPGLGGGSSGSDSGESSGGSGSGTTTGAGSGSGSGSDGTSTGDLGDIEVDLHCDWEQICGRGHAGLRSDGRNRAVDPVGCWAAKAAHAEAASVPAFVHLGRELVAHDAPEPLRVAAARAARDEVIHARMMSELARRRGATVPVPVVESLPVRDLEALATENAVEGCVRETWAALEAHYQARHAAAPELRAAMCRIAVDETRHAELARRIDAWCRDRLDDAAWARVEAARQRAVTELRARIGAASPAMARATGLPVGASARGMFDRLHAELWS